MLISGAEVSSTTKPKFSNMKTFRSELNVCANWWYELLYVEGLFNGSRNSLNENLEKFVSKTCWCNLREINRLPPSLPAVGKLIIVRLCSLGCWFFIWFMSRHLLCWKVKIYKTSLKSYFSQNCSLQSFLAMIKDRKFNGNQQETANQSKENAPNISRTLKRSFSRNVCFPLSARNSRQCYWLNFSEGEIQLQSSCHIMP